MKFALLQSNMTVGDTDANADKLAEAVRKAAARGARFCISTETALLGYPARDLLLRPDFIAEAGRKLTHLAEELRELPPLLVGTALPNESGRGKALYNCAVLLKDGRVQEVFRKSLLPNYDVFDEERYFEPGKGPGLLEWEGLRIAVTICEDIWNDTAFWETPLYPHDPLEALLNEKPDIIVNLSASPFTVGKQEVRKSILAAVAQKYDTHVLYCNQVGGNDDLVFDGRSTAFDPSGCEIARANAFDEDIVLVDTAEGICDMHTDDLSPEEETWAAMVLGTRDYALKCGFASCLLGLSGGLDSSLTAAVAAEALGPENVLGVLMPSPYTSQASLDDAHALAERLGMRTITVPIGPLMQGLDGALAEAFAGYEPGVTEENIQSRIRGNILMAMSNKFSSLLLTTGNKSELAVGYCTIYGDMSGGLAVISDVPKSFAYSICRMLNAERGEIIPQNVIDKEPTAELRPDQKDTDSLPPYELLDDMLERLIVRRQGIETIISAGFDRDMVEKIARLVKIAEFKRRQAAPGLKVTDVSFGTGWRMPVAARFRL
jgi:NAD+ synthetase